MVGVQELGKLYKGAVVVETDNTTVGKELQAGSTNRSNCFSLLADIKMMLLNFSSCEINIIVGRNCNSVAHELAAEARRNGNLTLIGRVPDTLQQVCLLDCNPTSR